MLRIEGDRDFPYPPPSVWIRLCDGRFLVECIPDVDSVTRAEPLEAEFVVRPGFAFVRGSLTTRIRISGAEHGQNIHYDVQSKGIGSHSAVAAVLALAPIATGTRVHWECEITELGGLLKAVPKGLIQATAQKVIDDIWESIEKRLAPPDRA